VIFCVRIYALLLVYFQMEGDFYWCQTNFKRGLIQLNAFQDLRTARSLIATKTAGYCPLDFRDFGTSLLSETNSKAIK